MTKPLTTKQVALLLGVSERRVQAMLKQQKKHFPNARQCECGVKWFIPASDVKTIKS